MKNEFMNNKCYNISDFFDLSQDVTFNDFVIHMMGNHRLIIENYKYVQCFTDENIVIKGNKRKIVIHGKKLEICSFGDKEIILSGVIYGLSYLFE